MFDFVNTDPFLVFFGSFFLVMGLSMFLATKPWNDFIDLFVQNEAISLILGVITLPIALFIIVFYNNWDTLGGIMLMVIGYLALAKAVVLLLRPKFMQALMNKEFVRKWLWMDGISGIILGAAMLVL